jgi:DNA-directed RNA polymerase subunit F
MVINMSEEKKNVFDNPRVQARLKDRLVKKFKELKALKKEDKTTALMVINSELVPEGEVKSVEAKKGNKTSFMNLDASLHYIKKFADMTPKQILEFIDSQSDMLMMFSKEAALKWLARASESDDPEALEMYLKVIQASAIVAQEKAGLQKIFGVEEKDTRPKQYIAPEMTKEEWEKTYKQGQRIVPAKEPDSNPIYAGPVPKTIN